MKSFGKLAVILMTSLALSTAQSLLTDNECEWPLETFRDLFVIACDVYDCEQKVTNCTEALIPKANVCALKDICKRQTLGSSSLPAIGNTRKLSTPQDSRSNSQMSDCIMQKIFDSLDIKYIPGDGLMNTVNYLNKTFGPNSGFDEELKLSMMEALVDDVCIVPENDDEMEMLKFDFCLLKVCVDNMPDNVDYEYDENADTGEEETYESVNAKDV